MYNSSLLVIQKLLNTNAYLGHRIPTSDFQGYLYRFRNEMAIINLEKTLICLRRACHFLLVNTNLEYNKIIQQMKLMTTTCGHYRKANIASIEHRLR
ncbi:hypothetical protein BDL97_12G075800 [Sphagnum fallax]|nr:hypothetical protein BDL97_12G075800 [Sphagnum fallax]